MREDITVGGTFPDYRLPDQDGRDRSLAELQGSNPMVLHLSRGGFDPKERRFVSRLVDAHVDFKLAYTALVVITTDDQLGLAEFRDGVGASFPFLSDPERRLARELDIQEYTDPVHDPMIPHTFVLAPGLRIANVYNGYWYWGRPTVDELHRDLREVIRVQPPRLRPRGPRPARGLGRRRHRAVPGRACRGLRRSATPRARTSASSAEETNEMPGDGRRHSSPLSAP